MGTRARVVDESARGGDIERVVETRAARERFEKLSARDMLMVKFVGVSDPTFGTQITAASLSAQA